ncbi:MAG: Rieske 2Fe-2S domain-containing protein [Actinomycetota bacterium]|nr:Rieske 2Fe-2S domain-containing protein [Actinomycetota bacterium]
MSPVVIAIIVVAVSVALFGLFMANITILRERKARAATAPAGTEAGARGEPATKVSEPAGEDKPKVTVEKPAEKKLRPLSPSQMAVSRRQFLNRAWTASFSSFLGFFGMATLSFLWPKLTGGFGSEITVGATEDLLKEVGAPNYTPKFVAEGRFWLVAYEGTGDAPIYELTGATKVKMQALYRKCVHLGCSVPHCEKSALFECPCHGSKYRLTGEYYGGPAPRGLDRFPIFESAGKIVVDTGKVETGPPRGTDTWPQFAEPKGPFCVPV